MEFIVLASGSKGNATYLEIGNEKILIDCGISYKQINERLAVHGKSIEGVTRVFITHEHSDHVKELVMLAKKHDVKIYMSEGSYSHLNKTIKYTIDVRKFQTIIPEEILEFDGFKVLPFMVYHDAYEPFGYRFIENDKSMVYITDTGYFPERKYHLISNAEAYIIESNHEVEMLLESDRPWLLKRRILDDEGHLSNEDAAHHLKNVIGENTRHIVLAHLSEENNHPDIAYEVLIETLKSYDIDHQEIKVTVAKQHEPTDMFHL